MAVRTDDDVSLMSHAGSKIFMVQSRLRLIKQIRRAIEIVLFTKNVSAQSLSILKQLLTTSGKSGKTKSPFLDSDSDLSFCVVLANNGFNWFSLSLTG